MNKKFTMMLAAFMAAGYSVTVEAGVVKVSAPSKGGTYVITAQVGSEDAYLSVVKPKEGPEILSASKLTSLSSAQQWTIEGETLSSAATIKAVNSTKGIKYGSEVFTFDATPSTDLKIVGNTNIAGSDNKELKFPTEFSKNVTTENANSGTDLTFHEVTSEINKEGVFFVVSSGKYLCIDKEGKLTEADAVTVLAMGTECAKWNISNGVVKSALYDFYLTEYGASTLNNYKVSSAKKDALIFSEGAVEDTWYFGDDATGSTTTDGSLDASNVIKAEADLTSTFNSSTPSALPGSSLVSNEANFQNVLIQSTVSVSGKTNYFSQTANAEATLAAYNNSNVKAFSWTYSNGQFKNANNEVLTIDGATKFEVVWVSAEQFFLACKVDGVYQFVNVNNSNGALSVAPATPTTFVAWTQQLADYADATFVDDMQGAFSVTYKLGDVIAENNPFTDVTPIAVSSVDEYPEGLYFVVNAPAGTETVNSWSKEELDKLTFLAVSPKDTYETAVTEKGVGAKFVEVKGSDLYKDAATATKDKKDKVAVQNARFDVKKSDLSSEDVVFALATIYVNDNNDLKSVNNITVAAINSNNEGSDKVVVSTITPDVKPAEVKNNIMASLGSENIATAADLLSTSEATIFNIQFLSQKLAAGSTDATEISQSEYLKYLTIAYNNGSDETVALAGSDFVDLSAAQNQWIITGMDDNNVVTFQNLENASYTLKTKLVKAGDNQYRLTSVDANSDLEGIDVMYIDNNGDVKFDATPANAIANNMVIKVTPVKFNASAGYVSNELDNLGLTKLSFLVENNYNSVELFLNTVFNTNGTINKIELNKEKSSMFEFVKATGDNSTINGTEFKYAFLKDGKATTDNNKKVKLALNQFGIKLYGTESEDGKEAQYLNKTLNNVGAAEEFGSSTVKFIIKKNVNGSYSLINAETNLATTIENNTYDISATGALETSENVYAIHSAKFNIATDKLNSSLEAKSQHVMFQNGNTYLAIGEAGKAIMGSSSELKAAYTKEELTFWLDTTDSKAYIPTFYISKGAKQYMFNAIDSTKVLDEGTGSYIENKDMYLPGTSLARAIFRNATLKDSETLTTSIDGESKDLTEDNGIKAYQYTITLKDEATEGEYIVKSKYDNKYLYRLNGELGFTSNSEDALVLTVIPTEAPTSNEAVTASEVKVVAQDGAVVVKNAAGKNVVVSTILGQVVANEVLTSDNATINVPAGIVVVAVEGESFKVNVK